MIDVIARGPTNPRETRAWYDDDKKADETFLTILGGRVMSTAALRPSPNFGSLTPPPAQCSRDPPPRPQ